jgi:hypothetical protein
MPRRLESTWCSYTCNGGDIAGCRTTTTHRPTLGSPTRAVPTTTTNDQTRRPSQARGIHQETRRAAEPQQRHRTITMGVNTTPHQRNHQPVAQPIQPIQRVLHHLILVLHHLILLAALPRTSRFLSRRNLGFARVYTATAQIFEKLPVRVRDCPPGGVGNNTGYRFANPDWRATLVNRARDPKNFQGVKVQKFRTP